MKKLKFRNIKTVIDGIKFASKKESKRYLDLELMQKDGLISELQLQEKFLLIPKQEGERACHYVCDFSYIENGIRIIEDVKSVATKKLPGYILKRKMMLFFHGIKIREVVR